MSRFNPHFPHVDSVLEAAALWKTGCFVEDKSILSEKPLWTKSATDELKRIAIDHEASGKDPFLIKLKRQLVGTSPAICQLMAEMLWVLNLFPSNIGASAKRKAVMEAWSWSGEQISPEHPMLTPEVLGGIGSGGPAFLMHRWRELRFLVTLTALAKSLAPEERLAILASPWVFAEWIDSVPDEGYRQLRHILPHLIFPDSFERMSSPGDIRKILLNIGGIDKAQLSKMSKVEQDKSLLALRGKLEAAGSGPIDFYEPALKQRWDPDDTLPTAPDGRAKSAGGGSPDMTKPPGVPALNQILYGPPGTGKTFRTVDRALEILDADFLLRHGEDRDAVKGRFDVLVSEGKIRFVTFHQSFSYEDFVEGIRAEARENGTIRYYVADGIFKEFCSRKLGRASFASGASLGGYKVLRSTDEILWLEKPNGSQLPLPWAIITELRDLVANGQLTLQDIRAGTVFDRLPESNLEKHIVNGYNNVFSHVLEAIEPARANTATEENTTAAGGPRVLIIDEINRGNISKIFGELITLIEPSKRAGAAEALSVTLPYSKERFEVPKDLYIIGTMNTADRSLATLDIALRRRFSFEEVDPDIDLLDGVELAGVDLAKLLSAINSRIELLLDRDHRIGHAYFLPLSASSDINALSRVFENQILPLLEEYFFEDWQRIRLVLNDHRKLDPADRFIVERKLTAIDLLGDGDLGVTTARAWEVNWAALERPSAYQSVIGE